MKVVEMPQDAVLWLSRDRYGYDTYCMASKKITGTSFLVVRGEAMSREDDKLSVCCSNLTNPTYYPKELYGIPADDWKNYLGWSGHPCVSCESEYIQTARLDKDELHKMTSELMENENTLVNLEVPMKSLAADKKEYLLKMNKGNHRYEIPLSSKVVFINSSGKCYVKLHPGGTRVAKCDGKYASGGVKVKDITEHFNELERFEGINEK